MVSQHHSLHCVEKKIRSTSSSRGTRIGGRESLPGTVQTAFRPITSDQAFTR